MKTGWPKLEEMTKRIALNAFFALERTVKDFIFTSLQLVLCPVAAVNRLPVHH